MCLAIWQLCDHQINLLGLWLVSAFCYPSISTTISNNEKHTSENNLPCLGSRIMWEKLDNFSIESPSTLKIELWKAFCYSIQLNFSQDKLWVRQLCKPKDETELRVRGYEFLFVQPFIIDPKYLSRNSFHSGCDCPFSVSRVCQLSLENVTISVETMLANVESLNIR